MRKIVLTLLTIVLLLSAVEWDVEQVTEEPDKRSGGSLISLDSEGYPHILFTQTDGSSNLFLKVATRQQDEWVQSDVAEVSQFLAVTYSLDVTPDNHNVVVYSGFIFEDDAELYLASDSTGDFEVMQLTDDNHSQDRPVVHVDDNNMIHIVYRYLSSDFTIDELFHGWIDISGFNTEQVTENLCTDIPPSFDFILDNSDLHHVFYTADDQEQGLWHATQTSLTALPAWSAQPTGLSGIWPSAAIDHNGNFHIACGDAYPTYITDGSGSWQEEAILDSGDDGFPSLAVDPHATPHVAMWHAPVEGILDVRYTGRTQGSWSAPQSLPPQGQDKYVGYGHYFAIDAQGYGHLTYAVEDTNYVNHVFYAKSTEPLTGSAIAEQPASSDPLNLEIRGSTVLLSLSEAGPINLDLYDITGRHVGHLAFGTYPAGEHEEPIDLSYLARGVYFVRGEVEGKPVGAKVVLVY